MRKLALLAAASIAAIGFAAPAQAQLTDLGYFPQQGAECSGGDFADCYASSNGVNVPGDNESAVIYKWNNPDSDPVTPDDFGNYGSITGTEFHVDYNSQTNTLSFTYTPDDPSDPIIHYFSIYQGGDPAGGPPPEGPGYELWYDANGITSGSIALSDFFTNSGWSHINWYDETPPGVPEPATWAMMLLGFGASGVALRRSRRRKGLITQIA